MLTGDAVCGYRRAGERDRCRHGYDTLNVFKCTVSLNLVCVSIVCVQAPRVQAPVQRIHSCLLDCGYSGCPVRAWLVYEGGSKGEREATAPSAGVGAGWLGASRTARVYRVHLWPIRNYKTHDPRVDVQASVHVQYISWFGGREFACVKRLVD